MEAWEARLIEIEAEVIRQQMAVRDLRLDHPQVALLKHCVLQTLDAERHALDALRAENVRQQHQQQRALKYG